MRRRSSATSDRDRLLVLIAPGIGSVISFY